MLKCYIHDIWYEGTKCPRCPIQSKYNKSRKREKINSISTSQHKTRTEKKWFNDGW